MELRTLEEKYFATESDVKHIEVINSEANYIIGQNHKKYLDFTSGWCVGNFGWANEAVTSAIRNFDGPTYVSPNMEYRPWAELAEMLAEITPGKLKKCFRATGGTEAVEIALQAAMEFTGRDKFIAVEGAYHGNSIAARALVNEDAPQPFQVKRIKPPLTEETTIKIEKWLKKKDVAAIIMEPVILNLEVEIPSQVFMTRIQDLCKKYGTLIIMDEVACGFGRTGRLFASEHFGMEPDIMTIAKAMTGGAAPIGAAIMTEQVAKKLQEENFPYSTYGWHPISVAAAIANINYIQDNWLMIDANSRSISEYFQNRLSMMNFKSDVDVRVMGLSIGLKFEDEEYGEKVVKRAFKQGVLLSEGISIFPSLNIDFETAKRGLDVIEGCL